MRDTFEQFGALYDKGLAVGHSCIRDDTINFEFRGEKFTFPTVQAHPIVTFNGYFFVAKIDDVRKLEAEAASKEASKDK